MRSRWLAPVLILALAVLAVLAWPHLPERMPVHWNGSFEVDRWGTRWEGVALLPGVALAVWLLLPLLRKIDPLRGNYEAWEPTFWLILNIVVLMEVVLEVAIIAFSLGWPVPMEQVILASVGVLFVGLGNYLPRVRPNWWVGIRTPWTLSSDHVWRETHRLGGRTFVLGGLITIAAAFVPRAAAPWVALAGLLLGAFVPVVYSYVVWRREAGGGD